MQNPHPAKRRVIALLAFFGAFLLLFAAVLYDAQILHGGENRAKSISSNAASETVTAPAASSPTATARCWCLIGWPIRWCSTAAALTMMRR